MSSPKHLFWDSCVFIRYLTKLPPELCADIEQYITQAKQGHYIINFSTVAYAEILGRHFNGTAHGDLKAFFRSLGRNFIPQDPNPNIMILSGLLRNVSTKNPDPRQEKSRVLGIPDAIQLATCVYLRDALGLRDIEMHTFDEGKGRGLEGLCIPMIGFENWYPNENRTAEIENVCALPRRKPKHPDPDIVTQAAAPAISAPSPSSERH